MDISRASRATTIDMEEHLDSQVRFEEDMPLGLQTAPKKQCFCRSIEQFWK